MKARLAFLTTPDPGAYVLNIQEEGAEEVLRIEIGPDQMKNILVDGVSLMLRSSFIRVPVNSKPEGSQ